MKELPDSFHILNLSGCVFYIDSEVRKEIEAFVRQCSGTTDPLAHITIESLTGEEIMVIADAVNSIYSTSPEIRTMNRAFSAIFNREDAIS